MSDPSSTEIAAATARYEEILSQCARALGVLDKTRTETVERIAEAEAEAKNIISAARAQAARIVADARNAMAG